MQQLKKDELVKKIKTSHITRHFGWTHSSQLIKSSLCSFWVTNFLLLKCWLASRTMIIQQLNMVFTRSIGSFIHVVKFHFNNSCYHNLTQWSDAPLYTIFITFVIRKHLFWVTHNDDFLNTFIAFVFKKHFVLSYP